jgi:hypothetical protein
MKNKTSEESEEIKNAEILYYRSLNIGIDLVDDIPSLKYGIYFSNINDVYQIKIKYIKKDIDLLLKKLDEYKGSEINISEQKNKLDDINKQLDVFLKESKEDFEFYRHYLVSLAKKSDVLNNKNVTDVYIKSSEELIKNKIQYFLKKEKNFILFKDSINYLKKFFNI